jgi:hypothetical protein
VDIKNAKNGAKTKKLHPKQDQGLSCKETKARRAKLENLDLIVRKLIWWKDRVVKT